jgi:hypothetical protein
MSLTLNQQEINCIYEKVCELYVTFIPESKICEHAVKTSQFHMLRWARLKGYPWGKTAGSAARLGYLEILKWTIKNGCPMHDCDYVFALQNQHFHILNWMFDVNYPMRQIQNRVKVDCYHTLKLILKLESMNLVRLSGRMSWWVKKVNRACEELTYDDLSNLIKSFI